MLSNGGGEAKSKRAGANRRSNPRAGAREGNSADQLPQQEKGQDSPSDYVSRGVSQELGHPRADSALPTSGPARLSWSPAPSLIPHQRPGLDRVSGHTPSPSPAPSGP